MTINKIKFFLLGISFLFIFSFINFNLVSSQNLTTFSGCKYACLKKGSNNELVKQLQTILKELGYYKGDTDSNFGPKTQDALRRFQKDFGLKEDGILGKKTLEAMRDELTDSQERIAQNSFNDLVKKAQEDNANSNWGKYALPLKNNEPKTASLNRDDILPNTDDKIERDAKALAEEVEKSAFNTYKYQGVTDEDARKSAKQDAQDAYKDYKDRVSKGEKPNDVVDDNLAPFKGADRDKAIASGKFEPGDEKSFNPDGSFKGEKDSEVDKADVQEKDFSIKANELNQKAAEAIDAGDYDTARKIFDERRELLDNEKQKVMETPGLSEGQKDDYMKKLDDFLDPKKVGVSEDEIPNEVEREKIPGLDYTYDKNVDYGNPNEGEKSTWEKLKDYASESWEKFKDGICGPFCFDIPESTNVKPNPINPASYRDPETDKLISDTKKMLEDSAKLREEMSKSIDEAEKLLKELGSAKAGEGFEVTKVDKKCIDENGDSKATGNEEKCKNIITIKSLVNGKVETVKLDDQQQVPKVGDVTVQKFDIEKDDSPAKICESVDKDTKKCNSPSELDERQKPGTKIEFVPGIKSRPCTGGGC